MRRIFIVFLSLAAAVSGSFLIAFAPPASGQSVPENDRARGLIYSGLRRAAPDSPCRGMFEAVTRGRSGDERTRCTHGPDPVPPDLPPGPAPGVAGPAPTGALAAEAGTVGCYGTGRDGPRVQLIYARAASEPDRYAQFEASFRTWAARVDDIFNSSAAKTGGIRRVRYVTDASCRPVIDRMVISAAAVGNVDVMLQDFDNAGVDRSDRKYLVWVDTPKQEYCGIGFSYGDDTRPDPSLNSNNGSAPGLIARVDTRCWGRVDSVEAHELLHTMGGVLTSSSFPSGAPPHATNAGHCTDESDLMCYADGGGNPLTGPVYRADGTPTSLQYVCPGSHEVLLDCGNDDYFSTNPPPGNWLATHWNTANSSWLERSPPPGTPGSTVVGSAWYSSGLNSQSGPAGTTIRVYAVGLFENIPYQLVTGRNGGTPNQPCRVDLVPANVNTRFANSAGFVSTTVGTVNRLPGSYQVCFAQTDPVTGNRTVSGVVTFTVT